MSGWQRQPRIIAQPEAQDFTQLLDDSQWTQAATFVPTDRYTGPSARIGRYYRQGLNELDVRGLEEKRQELAESVWQDGEAARGRGEADAAAALFEKAIDARGRGLCADDKQGRDRIVAMRRVLMEAKGGEEDKKAQAWAKMKLAGDLDDQGEFEEALALYQEAIELFTEVRFPYATSMCACAEV